MGKISWLTAEQWGIVGALGAAAQAVAALLALGAAIFAARYAADQVRQARLQVEEAQKARFDQLEQAAAQEQAARDLEFQRRKELAEQEERRQEELARPFVIVDFEPSPVFMNAINLVIENVGKTLAKSVRFTFDPPLESSQTEDQYRLKDSVLIKQGIPAMPPGRRVEAMFDLSHERFKTELPMTYRVRVESQDAKGREQEALEYVLDLNFRYGLLHFDVKTIHHAAKSLREIEKNLKKFTAHFNGVRVWVRDEDAYLAAQAKDFEDYKAQEALRDKVARAQAAGVPLSELDDFEREDAASEDSESSP
ncbi:hypothetical protein [Kribbella sp. CA-293567]|uniref:hypothetical protein n=1 Tax=Kribbella sp. CA-293567 TaxID=3002436 RepID=UPI0022DD7153|nr:hypothetical protein [Kribbella sp. CA-293567]WBQ06824.1 hypothetical protein OX958_08520 [Kribbella sp. CA-293567]